MHARATAVRAAVEDNRRILEGIIGESRALAELRPLVARIASASSSVLITGETGTGKELFAQAIHRASPRRAGPFVCVNCAAIPESLFESELFGYERGAFTGAHRDYGGKLVEASGGTLFLDEIGELSYTSQAKLLRALETKMVCPLGGMRQRAVDFRLVAATNRELDKMARDNSFRPDLFYRLNVARLRIPALRDRRDDVALLVEHFRAELNHQFALRIHGFAGPVLTFLASREWPGNIRELRNALESIYLHLPEPCPLEISLRHLVPVFPELAAPSLSEDDELLAALTATNWNKSKAAQKLKWSRMTVYRKLAKLHLAPAAALSPEPLNVTADVTPNGV